LCLYADFLLFWVDESESEVPVDLGAVGGLGFGEGCGDVAECWMSVVICYGVMVLAGWGGVR
jgi:hypothetical protein